MYLVTDSSIGIDQTNMSERNHQVNFMDQVYSSAQTVRMCIGEPPIFIGLTRYENLFAWLRGDDTRDLPDADPNFFPTLKTLLSLSYFRRVWVIEEVAKARAAFLTFSSHQLLLSPLVMERLHLLSIHNKYQLPGVLRWDPAWSSGVDIVTALSVGVDCEATDPRDRVYALLSLMRPNDRSLILVSYGIKIGDLYKQAIITILRVGRSLALLSYADDVQVSFVGEEEATHLRMAQLRQHLLYVLPGSRFDLAT